MSKNNVQRINNSLRQPGVTDIRDAICAMSDRELAGFLVSMAEIAQNPVQTIQMNVNAQDKDDPYFYSARRQENGKWTIYKTREIRTKWADKMRRVNEFGSIRLKLKELMEERNLSLTELSECTEIQAATLRGYYNNDLTRYEAAILSRLCYAFECELGNLIEYVPLEE